MRGLDPRIHRFDPDQARSDAVLILVDKAFSLHRQVHLVLERGVAVGHKQACVVGNRVTQRRDPGPVGLGEIGQDVDVRVP